MVTTHPLPGSNVVGRGIYLMPRQPYQLRDLLFTAKGILTGKEKTQQYFSKETKQTYTVPEGYEVNDSPPMPAAKALNQMTIEESFERFEKSTALDAKMAAGNGMFSVSANISSSSQVRSDEDAYYAMRSSFIPLWSVYLPVVSSFSEEELLHDIPVPFRQRERSAYHAFFARYGTHYVRRVWVGGKADLTFIIAKSSEMSKEDIQAGLSASYGSLSDAQLNSGTQQQKEQLQANSNCLVTGKGGDELLLASLGSLDDKLYNQWLASINNNPQVIELEVEGIWTLLEDKAKAQALQTAYRTATVFRPISSMLRVKESILFIRRDKYTSYNTLQEYSQQEQSVNLLWPALAKAGIYEIDAVFEASDLISPEGKDLSGKAFFFDEERVVLMDLESKSIYPDYPLSIQDAWPGLPFSRIDAAVNAGSDALYFFTGNQYVRYNYKEQRVEDGYPQQISQRWAGVTFDRIDAAAYWGNGKVYFFRDDQYICYDMTMYRADPGYPKSVVGNYLEDMKF